MRWNKTIFFANEFNKDYVKTCSVHLSLVYIIAEVLHGVQVVQVVQVVPHLPGLGEAGVHGATGGAVLGPLAPGECAPGEGDQAGGTLLKEK